LKSISDSLLCSAFVILRFVTGFVGKPFSILTIVPKDTDAFVAMSMILNPFSKRISFNVLISITESQIIHYEKSIESGSTPKALANLRIVTKRGFCLPCSSRQMVFNATPDSFERSDWEMNFFNRKSLSEAMVIF
jgi:hypothetical protein